MRVKTFTDDVAIKRALELMYEYPLSERPLVEISYRSCSGIGRTEGVLLSIIEYGF